MTSIAEIVSELEPLEVELIGVVDDIKKNPDKRIAQKRSLKMQIADLHDRLLDEMDVGEEVEVNGKRRKKDEKTRIKYNKEGISDFCTAKELLLSDYDQTNKETVPVLTKTK